MSEEHFIEQKDRAYFTRSKITEYKAAGVLPLAVVSNEVLVLLGAETVRTGPKGKIRKRLWRDFGGSREAIDADSEDTAGREFAEETLGLFAGCEVNADMVARSAEEMANQLRKRDRVLKVIHPLKKGTYHMFLAATHYLDPLMFQLATQQNESTGAVVGAEKTAFAWVSLKSLLAATCGMSRRCSVCCTSSCSGVRRSHCGRHTRPLNLHPCFVSSLRIAKTLGVLDLAHNMCINATNPTPAAAMKLPDNLLLANGPVGIPDWDSEDRKGITSEHLLYWLLQEQVAELLGFDREQLLKMAHQHELCNDTEDNTLIDD